MTTKPEPFASIDGAEGVGIRASSADSGVNIREASYWRECLFSVDCCSVRCPQRIGGWRHSARNPLRTADATNGSRPFFLAKLCLIPPFSP